MQILFTSYTYVVEHIRECVSMGAAGDLWDIIFCTRRQILRLLVLLKPADFEAQSSLL